MKKLLSAMFALIMAIGLCSPVFATRTTITTSTPAPILAGAPSVGALDTVWTAADVSNGNDCVLSGNDLLFAWNTGVSPYTVTVTSTPDGKGRSGDIGPYTITAGTISLIGPIPTEGFAQSSNGHLNVSASNILVKFLILRVPGYVTYK